jgi:hypothetical protein
MDQRLQWALSEILEKLKPDFYGSFILQVESGKITYVRVEQSIKPPKSIS